jgi:cellulose synthase/poly-beta-1,6-N-acetylglucosamine synthase-like glycosyltransferase
MQISNIYFRNGITFFTNLIYIATRFGVSNGDVAPFAGHNTVLRWSAIQEVAFETNGVLKFSSESHVSKDFDMALRLYIKGYIIRLAAWAGDGFKEGVSLTVSPRHTALSTRSQLLIYRPCSGLRRTRMMAEV